MFGGNKFRIFTFWILTKLHILDHQYYLALHDEPDGQGDIGAGVYRETVIRGGVGHLGAV